MNRSYQSIEGKSLRLAVTVFQKKSLGNTSEFAEYFIGSLEFSDYTLFY